MMSTNETFFESMKSSAAEPHPQSESRLDAVVAENVGMPSFSLNSAAAGSSRQAVDQLKQELQQQHEQVEEEQQQGVISTLSPSLLPPGEARSEGEEVSEEEASSSGFEQATVAATSASSLASPPPLSLLAAADRMLPDEDEAARETVDVHVHQPREDSEGDECNDGSPSHVTFIAVKPDGMTRRLVPNIVRRLEQGGLTMLSGKTLHPTLEQAQRHYAEHVGKPFYNTLCDYFSSPPGIFAMVWEGEGAVQTARALIGKPGVRGTIRGDYTAVGETTQNVVHGSDSNAAAAREIDMWLPIISSPTPPLPGAASSGAVARGEEQQQQIKSKELPEAAGFYTCHRRVAYPPILNRDHFLRSSTRHPDDENIAFLGASSGTLNASTAAKTFNNPTILPPPRQSAIFAQQSLDRSRGHLVHPVNTPMPDGQDNKTVDVSAEGGAAELIAAAPPSSLASDVLLRASKGLLASTMADSATLATETRKRVAKGFSWSRLTGLHSYTCDRLLPPLSSSRGGSALDGGSRGGVGGPAAVGGTLRVAPPPESTAHREMRTGRFYTERMARRDQSGHFAWTGHLDKWRELTCIKDGRNHDKY